MVFFTVIYSFLTLEQFIAGLSGMNIDCWVMKTMEQVSPLVLDFTSLPLPPTDKIHGKDLLKVSSAVYVVNSNQSVKYTLLNSQRKSINYIYSENSPSPRFVLHFAYLLHTITCVIVASQNRMTHILLMNCLRAWC